MCACGGWGVGREDGGGGSDNNVKKKPIDLLIMFRFSVLNSLTTKEQTTKFSSANLKIKEILTLSTFNQNLT